MTNFVKKLFLVALFNYILIGAVVLAFNKPNNSGSSIIPVAKPTPNNSCIITIDGLQYDVTDFRNLHSGGNVFTCGTDMSIIFHQQHSDRFLNQMQRYKI